MIKYLATYCTAFLAVLCPTLSFADGYKVPAIANNANDPLPLFAEEKPLLPKEYQALQTSRSWIDAKQYPFRDDYRTVYLYGAGQATIVCAPLKLCIVQLEEDEKVVKDGVQLGDTARWMVSPAVGGKNQTHIIIKPVDVGLDTSLVLVTNRRTYYMRLVSRKNDYMPVVAFHYPDKMKAQWDEYYKRQQQEAESRILPDSREDITSLDFDYDIDGCDDCSWRPLRVYNNGEHTIIQMNKDMKNTESPALLVTTNQGDELVNYRVKGDRYIVDRIFKEAVLIVGVGDNQDRVTITHTR